MRAPFVIDGQRQPRPPERPINLLDEVGIDRRMTPQPLVCELSGFDEWYFAGGDWIATIPAELL